LTYQLQQKKHINSLESSVLSMAIRSLLSAKQPGKHPFNDPGTTNDYTIIRKRSKPTNFQSGNHMMLPFKIDNQQYTPVF